MKKSLIGLLFASLFIFLSRAAVQENEYYVPYVSTPDVVVAEMLRIADVGKDDVLYDLGCGDGRIVITAAKKMDCRGVGVDIDPQRIKDSRENAVRAKVTDRVQFFQQDLFEANISEATVVTLYLLTSVNLKLRPKLLRELKPGTRVVSHDFSMGEWRPDKTSKVSDYYENHTVYYWVVPANVTGTWKWTMPSSAGKKRYVLKLDQQFQQVNGTVFAGVSEMPIEDAVIRGDRLQFTMEQKLNGLIVRMLFEGRVSGDSIKGSVKLGAEPRADKGRWRAKRDPFTITPLDRSNKDLN